MITLTGDPGSGCHRRPRLPDRGLSRRPPPLLRELGERRAQHQAGAE